MNGNGTLTTLLLIAIITYILMRFSVPKTKPIYSFEELNLEFKDPTRFLTLICIHLTFSLFHSSTCIHLHIVATANWRKFHEFFLVTAGPVVTKKAHAIATIAVPVLVWPEKNNQYPWLDNKMSGQYGPILCSLLR